MDEELTHYIKEEVIIPEEIYEWDTYNVENKITFIKTEQNDAEKGTIIPNLDHNENTYDSSKMIVLSLKPELLDNDLEKKNLSVGSSYDEGIRSKFKAFCRKCGDKPGNFKLENNSCKKCRSSIIVHCVRCKKRFKTTSTVMRHKSKKCDYKRVYKPKLYHKKYCCNDCDFETLYKTSLNNHILAKHSIDKQVSFKCTKCGKTSDTFTNYQSHRKYCGKPLKECRFCSYKTHNNYRMKRHFTLHDKYNDCTKIDNANQPVEENVIILANNSKSDSEASNKSRNTFERTKKAVKLRIDRMIESFCEECETKKTRDKVICKCIECGAQIKKFRCLELNCQKEFTNLYYVRLHITRKHIHTDQVDLNKCLTCGKCFGNRQNLRNHQNVCGKEPNIKCGYCNFKTKWGTNLTKHVTRMHKNLTKKDQVHVCDKCSRKFNCSRALDTHSRYCGKTTTTLRCAHCVFFTFSREALIGHLKQHFT